MPRISLDSLCGGALLERFQLAMAQIGRNIMDPNTNPEKARTLTIKITFKPDKSRKGIKTSIITNISLAPPEADETVMLIGQDLRTGRIEMSEYGDNSQKIQVATMQVGVASKADVIVPNPVTLVPFRTFQEVPQPSSKFVFRMGDKEVPAFKIVEAEGGIWKNEAIQNIKNYLESALGDMAEFITSNITIIG